MNAITRFKALFARELTCSKHICICIQFKLNQRRATLYHYQFHSNPALVFHIYLEASSLKIKLCMK